MGHSRQCNKWGGYTMFIIGRKWRILARAAQYYSAQMLTQQWLQPGEKLHEIYPVSTDQASRNASVTAYAAKRPDGRWAVMLVNKDSESHSVHVDFTLDNGGAVFSRSAIEATFGVEQYHWNGDSQTEVPSPNLGIAVAPTTPTSDGAYIIAPLSIT